jgi:hypothetical protein
MGRKHRPRVWTAQKNHRIESPTSQRCRERKQKELDLQGIEPWTTPMLREYYTTKPQARFAAFALFDELWAENFIHKSNLISHFGQPKIASPSSTKLSCKREISVVRPTSRLYRNNSQNQVLLRGLSASRLRGCTNMLLRCLPGSCSICRS